MKWITPVLVFALLFPQALGQAVWRGQTYTNRVCNSPYCTMCNSIQRQLSVQRSVQYPAVTMLPVAAPQPAVRQSVNPGQGNTPDGVIDEALKQLNLTPWDTLADYGCGDGRVLIRAARDYGCYGVGIEIDKHLARQARENVIRAEVAGQIPKNSITIVTGDVRDFNAEEHGVTAAYAYLYEELLIDIADELREIGNVVTPFHQVPGLSQEKTGECYVYHRGEVQGRPEESVTEWDILGGEEPKSEWIMTSMPKLDVWFYSQPWCGHCKPMEKWLRSVPWIHVKKRTGNKVPQWVGVVPTIVWKNADGKWKQLRGWHGGTETLSIILQENPGYGKRVTPDARYAML